MEHLEIDQAAIRWSEPIDPLRPLLLLLHGRGAHEGDLFDLVRLLPSEPVVASLRATFRDGPGFSWYLREMADPDAAARASVRAITDWLDSLPTPASIGLLGFSQGGAMSIELLRDRPNAYAYAVQLSGFVLEGALPGDAELAARRPPVFWGRGTEDEVVNEQRIVKTAAWLPEHTTLDARTYPIGHSISAEEMVDVTSFIRAAQ